MELNDQLSQDIWKRLSFIKTSDPDSVRAIVYILVRRYIERQYESRRPYFDRLSYKDVSKLAHYDINSPQIPEKRKAEWKEVQSIVMKIVDQRLLVSAQEVLNLILTMECNSFNIPIYTPPDRTGFQKAEATGYGLYPMASYFNHSCSPNVEFTFDKVGRISFETIKAVNPGEELFVSYGNITTYPGTQEDENEDAPDPAVIGVPAYQKLCKASIMNTFYFDCGCKIES